ncbi:putative double-stranded RNA-binding domain-containing protein [Helianthus annuus]|uniref:Double-stranded RNA-binding domain-containing protein n=1 Tax=Helianthus annuus TaxID=4232 RepID=A0A251VDM3_HELAN|nr:uncharacterized protein LOC110930775 isoform X2 [Helianthus annuus]KAF5816389.1 putative double-stranded RNA-binding domain-containing protein [Helianthus annuus]
MGFKGAMEIDFPSEVGPTKETVDALMEYLVGPLLPLKHTDFAKETPSESKQKSVAKQVHAAVVLYNYYHLNHHREIQFLKFDQFCKLATELKPGILRHMKFTCQSDRTILDDPENQLSITEKAIMDACTISETLLNASANISNVINEWQVTKVAVLLIDSKKENCFLQFNNGVWSVIEKDVYPESKKRKKVMIEYDNDGLQKLAFLAVKEVAGIVYHELKVLESHVVYSLSQAKTATRFYIVQSTQEISEDNLVPIQDVISSLQGPVVKECLGSWGITPVVEYYYLLPYAEIISKLFSRESNSLPNEVKDESSDVSIGQRSQKSCEKESGESKKVSGNVQKKSKLDSEVVHNSKKESGQSKEVSNNLQKKSNMESETVHVSNSIKEESRDSKDSKSAYKSNECSEKESGQSKEVSDNLQKKSKLDSETERVSSSVKEESHDSKVSKNGCESNQFSYTSESVSKVADDAITSQFTATHVDQKVKDSENSVGNSITVSNGDGVKQEDMNGSSGADNKLDVDKLLVCFQKESQNSKVQAPLKVYRHVKRSTPTKSTNSKAANTEDLKKTSTVSQSKDERVNGDKGSCMVPPNEDRSLTVNYVLEDFHSIVDAKRSELSDAALRALLHKRQKLYDQQRVIEGELTLCDKKIHAIMHGGIGDCLGLKLEAVIDCCNEICNQDDMQTQQRTKLLVSRSVPLLSGKSLSEAQLTLRKACQELDDICLSNDWMLPTYSTSRSDGGFVANVTVKGANFECSGVSGNLPSIHEARNSAATHMIMRLQQMANGTKTATLA